MTTLAERGVDPVEHFLSFADVRGPSECWPWLRGKTYGYGHYTWNGWQGSAHRWAYRAFVGEIPDGMPLDHQCHTAAVMVGACAGGSGCEHRACVNPRHLEVVTPQLNIARGVKGAPVVCHRGHPFDDENVHLFNGHRSCRECRRINYAIRTERKRAEAMARGEWKPWTPVTECKWGHPYSGDNLHIVSTTGTRTCKECRRQRTRDYKARKRAERALLIGLAA